MVGVRRRGRSADRQPTILVVATVAQTVDSFLLPHLEALAAKGNRVVVACAGTPHVSLPVEAVSLPVSRRPLDLLGHARTLRVLRRLIRLERPNVVELHTPIAAALGRLASAGSAPVVYFCHGFHFQQGDRNVWLPVEWLLRRLTQHIIVINREDRQQAHERVGYEADRIDLMPGVGIDVEGIGAARSESSSATEPPVLLTIGRLAAGKRPIELVDAFEELEHSTAQLWFAGDGELEPELRSRIESSPRSDRIRLLGQIEDIPALLSSATCFVHLSLREGLPVAVMEAAASGLPIVAFGRRGMVDVLDQYPAWVQPADDDPAAIAAAMDCAVETPRLSRDEASTALEPFGVERSVTAHLGILGAVAPDLLV